MKTAGRKVTEVFNKPERPQEKVLSCLMSLH